MVSIPTILIYYRGELQSTLVGAIAKNVLGNAVNKILEDLGLDDRGGSSSAGDSGNGSGSGRRSGSGSGSGSGRGSGDIQDE